MSSLVPQSVKDSFLQALTAYTAVLQEKVDAAVAAKGIALTHADTSGAKAIEATGAAATAVTKAAEAVLSALASYDWANKAEDSPVQNGEFSAYHHRRKAEIAAQQVLTALAGSVSFKGQWSASGDSFPADTSSGWMYRINAGGTLTFEDVGTKLVSIGDYILKTDSGWTYIDEATDAVKTSRTINGKPLNVDIVLTPADIQAVALSDLADESVAIAGTDDTKWMTSLKVRKALENLGIGITGIRPIMTNLDEAGLASGFYRTGNPTTGTFPRAGIKNAVVIVVRQTTNTANMLMMYPAGDCYSRSGGTTWTTWRPMNPDTYGIGGSMAVAANDLNTMLVGGLYTTPNANLVNLPAGWDNRSYALFVMGGTNYATQILTDLDSDTGSNIARMAIRRMKGAGLWSAWFEIYHTGTLAKQSTLIDTNPSAFLTPKSFGLGGGVGGGINLVGLDDVAIPSGFYNVVTATTGTKPASLVTDMTVIVHKYDDDQVTHTLTHTLSNRKFTRTYAQSAWTSWTEMFDVSTPISSHAELKAKLEILSLQVALAI